MVESLKDLHNQLNGNLNLLYGNLFDILNDILSQGFQSFFPLALNEAIWLAEIIDFVENRQKSEWNQCHWYLC